jgi:glycosyltransferase involved in cell wall biosynthesis
VLGEVGGWVTGLEFVYRAADMVITPHRIATRTMREALACGCPVVADTSCAYTPWRADAENPVAFAKEMEAAWRAIEYTGKPLVRQKCRAVAEHWFDPAATGRAFMNILGKVVSDGRSGV